MQRRQHLNHDEPEQFALIWLFLPAGRGTDPADEPDGTPWPPQRAGWRDRLRPGHRTWTWLRDLALSGLAVAAWVALAAFAADHAATVGATEAFRELMVVVASIAAGAAVLALLWAGVLTHRRVGQRGVAELRVALASAAGGFAGSMAALAVLLLSAAGLIPIP
ncbi:MAG: hypothetical protein F4Z51_00800 [Chloroflexi bacterium]|nr:hypothetical protein [Chloroflexota bacterium]MYD15992.1 hypothetical protein [Chloroflexota bacterium]MYF22830.1 hypothetical protein [Chloroflexota bacterium]